MKEEEIILLFKSEFSKVGNILGDDAGYTRIGDKWLIITADMLVWRTDIPDFMTPREAGKKVVTMNMSDIAAMGARPIGFFFSLGIPKDTDDKTLRGIARGIREGVEEYGVEILSGDTNDSLEIIIDGGAIGIGERLLLRSGAKPGDLVCVTGDLGRPLLALALWLKGEKIPKEVAEKVKNPKARVKEGLKLAKYATSAIDISDGLSKELWEISRKSNVKIIIDPANLPIHPRVLEIAKDPVRMALASGEEFELVFTVPKDEVESIDLDFTIIGEVKEGQGVYIKEKGKIKELPILGWEHFTHHSELYI
ncbi:thiamine-phosphate kinase [Pyrococcus sp. ST04]|uniref:thiamine-phosphate kinase n=1 Tax=Pyrococcus sp. ST04 TaxID=1183377 RepID=UPI0002605FAC|nr:thiamine-phosphate kinase [Pyrococcus sp. ST04]AFK23332.1 thiamine monophosphate kinase [Pyrococcus sp. ST04]